jgi:hypothetical protein
MSKVRAVLCAWQAGRYAPASSKASFLKHISDEPRFGNEPTSYMLTTEDLAAACNRRHHPDSEAKLQEIERHRREIEHLQAELNASFRFRRSSARV